MAYAHSLRVPRILARIESRPADEALARRLVLEALFALTLYQVLSRITEGTLKQSLDARIGVERKRLQFWKDFFQWERVELDWGRRLKIGFIVFCFGLCGDRSVPLILEAVETASIRKSLKVWRAARGTLLAGAVKEALGEDFHRGDRILSEPRDKILNAWSVRKFLSGFNGGLAQLLGALSGFSAAFQDLRSVLIAGFAVSAVGTLGAGLGAFRSAQSENETKQAEWDKARFLSRPALPAPGAFENPWLAGGIVGAAYGMGAGIPILPLFFGAQGLLVSWIFGGVLAALASLILAFVSGADVKKRVASHLFPVLAVGALSYAFGAWIRGTAIFRG